jgi:hypothetical protein
MSDNIKIYSKIKLTNNDYIIYGAKAGMEGYIIEIYESNDGKVVRYEIQLIDKKTKLPTDTIFSVKKSDIKDITPPNFI